MHQIEVIEEGPKLSSKEKYHSYFPYIKHNFIKMNWETNRNEKFEEMAGKR